MSRGENLAIQGHSSRLSEIFLPFSRLLPVLERVATNNRRGWPVRSWHQALKWVIRFVGGISFPALLNVQGEGLNGDGALRQWRLKVDTSIHHVRHDIAVILVSPEALVWVG